MSRPSERAESRTRGQGHYHVDVFRVDGRFVRGLTLQKAGDAEGRYRVVDDCGFLPEAQAPEGEPLALEDALRRALVLVRRHVGGPVTPVFGSAPFDRLGYRRPGLFRPGQEVDEDGNPGGTFRFKRGLPEGAVLVSLEEDGIGIYSRPKGGWRASFALSRRAFRALRDPAAEKPIAVVARRSPAWLPHLTFAFDLLFEVLETAPGGSAPARVRFENPPSGAVFVEADLVPRGALPLARACAESAIGNKVDEGRLVVDDRALRFRCECLSHVDVWMALPEGGAWLTSARLREISAAVAARNGVTLA